MPIPNLLAKWHVTILMTINRTALMFAQIVPRLIFHESINNLMKPWVMPRMIKFSKMINK